MFFSHSRWFQQVDRMGKTEVKQQYQPVQIAPVWLDSDMNFYISVKMVDRDYPSSCQRNLLKPFFISTLTQGPNIRSHVYPPHPCGLYGGRKTGSRIVLVQQNSRSSPSHFWGRGIFCVAPQTVCAQYVTHCGHDSGMSLRHISKRPRCCPVAEGGSLETLSKGVYVLSRNMTKHISWRHTHTGVFFFVTSKPKKAKKNPRLVSIQ